MTEAERLWGELSPQRRIEVCEQWNGDRVEIASSIRTQFPAEVAEALFDILNMQCPRFVGVTTTTRL